MSGFRRSRRAAGPERRPPLGAVLAGGRSRRYGSPKARAPVAGVPMGARVLRALRPHAEPVILVGGEEELAGELGVTTVPDRRPGRGPLAGVEAALERAREEGRDGVLVAACDLPLLSPDLFAALLARARESSPEGTRPLVVVPEGGEGGRHQPLCGWYATGALQPIRGLLDEGVRSMEEALQRLPVTRLRAREVSRIGPPEELFLNVNTPGDRRRAEEILARHAGAGG